MVRLIRLIGQDDIIMVCLAVIAILLGVATVKVSIYGRHVGRLKLVSNVQKYPQPPNRYQRRMTAGLGAAFILAGVVMLVLEVLMIQKLQS